MKKQKKIGLKDIAKEANVSVATVSYVLSDIATGRVGTAMTSKIKKIAKNLNYRPNRVAQSLKSGKTLTIGLVVADISNPFFGHIARIVEDRASMYNYTVIFGSSDEKPKKSMHLLEFLTNRQVDGFILAPTEGSEDQIAFLQQQNIPFVLIDRYFPKIDTNYVVIDNFRASYEATERLIHTGNSKIGMMAYGTDFYHMRQRVEGYEAALKKNGITRQVHWLKEIDVSKVKTEVGLAIAEMLDGADAVEAIFFATNTLAINGLKHFGEMGIKVPTDIRVVSFDEGEAFDFFYCPLTYIKQPLIQLAEHAVTILIEQIADQEAPTRHVALNAELIVRESCS